MKENFMVWDILSKAALAPSKMQDVAKQADTLRTSLLAPIMILTFKLKAEAPVPAGFPAPTPIGVVEIKKLPIYRMAKVNNFFTLFHYIKKNNIEMDMAEKKWQVRRIIHGFFLSGNYSWQNRIAGKCCSS